MSHHALLAPLHRRTSGSPRRNHHEKGEAHMRFGIRTLSSGIAMLSVAGVVHAATAPKHDVQALENSRDDVTWEAQNAKGIDQQDRRDEAQRLQGMIDTLNRGERVDPAEIDRTLNRTR